MIRANSHMRVVWFLQICPWDPRQPNMTSSTWWCLCFLSLMGQYCRQAIKPLLVTISPSPTRNYSTEVNHFPKRVQLCCVALAERKVVLLHGGSEVLWRFLTLFFQLIVFQLFKSESMLGLTLSCTSLLWFLLFLSTVNQNCKLSYWSNLLLRMRCGAFCFILVARLNGIVCFMWDGCAPW